MTYLVIEILKNSFFCNLQSANHSSLVNEGFVLNMYFYKHINVLIKSKSYVLQVCFLPRPYMFTNLIKMDIINYRYNKVNPVDKIPRTLLLYPVFSAVLTVGFFLNESQFTSCPICGKPDDIKVLSP